MSDFTDSQMQQIRSVIRDELADQLPGGKVFEKQVRSIVREELAPLHDDLKAVRIVQSQQGMTLRSMNTALVDLQSSYRHQAGEVTRVSVLLEDLEHRFEAGNEL